jgi:hypothetical protein
MTETPVGITADKVPPTPASSDQTIAGITGDIAGGSCSQTAAEVTEHQTTNGDSREQTIAGIAEDQITVAGIGDVPVLSASDQARVETVPDSIPPSPQHQHTVSQGKFSIIRVLHVSQYLPDKSFCGGSVRYLYVSIDLKMRYTRLHTLLGK